MLYLMLLWLLMVLVLVKLELVIESFGCFCALAFAFFPFSLLYFFVIVVVLYWCLCVTGAFFLFFSLHFVCGVCLRFLTVTKQTHTQNQSFYSLAQVWHGIGLWFQWPVSRMYRQKFVQTIQVHTQALIRSAGCIRANSNTAKRFMLKMCVVIFTPKM